MQIKNELRKIIQSENKKIENRDILDRIICENLFSLEVYKNAKTVLCYYSLKNEISTSCIIEQAMSEGKCVALPYCTDKNGHMDFYIVSSLNDLITGSFGIMEPNVEKCSILEDFDNSVCIVPALCYDRHGYRLGHGKGYYDRFLEKYSFISIGLCYNSLIQNEVPTDNFDKSVDYIVTDTQIITCHCGG